MEINSHHSPSSETNPLSHFDSFTASVSAMYSVSVVDRATTYCNDDFHLTAPPNKVKTKPVTNLLLSKPPIKFEST